MYFREGSQRQYSRQAERRALVIEKYEQLHQDLTEIDSSIGLLGVDLIGVAGLGDKIELGKYTDKIPMSSALMHAEFYAPEILPYLEPLQPKLTEFYQLVFMLRSSKDKNEKERLDQAQAGIDISYQVKEIIKIANKKLAELAKEVIHGA